MDKQTVKRLAFLLLWGVFTAAVIYPVLHEAGHIAAGVAASAKGIKAGFDGGVYVSVRLPAFDLLKRFIIGLGGMLMPLILAVALPKKRFFFWYTRLMLLMCCELSFAVSLVSAALRVNLQDDYFAAACGTVFEWVYSGLCAVLLIMLFFCIKMQKPIKKIISDYILKKG